VTDGAPIRDPARLLREMRPRLNEGAFAFCTVPAGAAVPAGAIGWFREAEGESVILPLATARAAGLAIVFEAGWITLEVHSAFDAVGLTAAVATALAAEGIPCNVVAAVRHDHIFVPVDRATDALAALERTSARG
jgi:uncharacterized protein